MEEWRGMKRQTQFFIICGLIAFTFAMMATWSMGYASGKVDGMQQCLDTFERKR